LAATAALKAFFDLFADQTLVDRFNHMVALLSGAQTFDCENQTKDCGRMLFEVFSWRIKATHRRQNRSLATLLAS
jgi:hypothetical protein